MPIQEVISGPGSGTGEPAPRSGAGSRVPGSWLPGPGTWLPTPWESGPSRRVASLHGYSTARRPRRRRRQSAPRRGERQAAPARRQGGPSTRSPVVGSQLPGGGGASSPVGSGVPDRGARAPDRGADPGVSPKPGSSAPHREPAPRFGSWLPSPLPTGELAPGYRGAGQNIWLSSRPSAALRGSRNEAARGGDLPVDAKRGSGASSRRSWQTCRGPGFPGRLATRVAGAKRCAVGLYPRVPPLGSTPQGVR